MSRERSPDHAFVVDFDPPDVGEHLVSAHGGGLGDDGAPRGVVVPSQDRDGTGFDEAIDNLGDDAAPELAEELGIVLDDSLVGEVPKQRDVLVIEPAELCGSPPTNIAWVAVFTGKTVWHVAGHATDVEVLQVVNAERVASVVGEVFTAAKFVGLASEEIEQGEVDPDLLADNGLCDTDGALATRAALRRLGRATLDDGFRLGSPRDADGKANNGLRVERVQDPRGLRKIPEEVLPVDDEVVRKALATGKVRVRGADVEENRHWVLVVTIGLFVQDVLLIGARVEEAKRGRRELDRHHALVPQMANVELTVPARDGIEDGDVKEIRQRVGQDDRLPLAYRLVPRGGERHPLVDKLVVKGHERDRELRQDAILIVSFVERDRRAVRDSWEVSRLRPGSLRDDKLVSLECAGEVADRGAVEVVQRIKIDERRVDVRDQVGVDRHAQDRGLFEIQVVREKLPNVGIPRGLSQV
mmetsp:Transcript_10170/g.32662  ORF Transcript_10170/g.32662 Transcript_10170/m.32662 type:complete len:470 (+) Transcript_10170:246-1655(+)